MSKKNLPRLKDADNVCDCAEEAERRKRLAAGGGVTDEPKGLFACLGSSWLPILGVSALVLSLFGILYKVFSKKKCRKPARLGTGWGGEHNLPKVDDDSSGVPLCPCEVKLNPKKRKWPLDDKKKK